MALYSFFAPEQLATNKYSQKRSCTAALGSIEKIEKLSLRSYPKIIKITLSIVCAVLLACVASSVFAQNINFILDTGFENSRLGWSLPADCGSTRWRVTTEDSHTGNRSLKLTNPTMDVCTYPLKGIPVYPGKRYTLTGWIKTYNVSGNAPGATLIVQWYDKNNKWLGYAQAAGITGTNDWQRVSVDTAVIPSNAAYLRMAPYLTKGCSGTVLWDDLEIKVLEDQVVNLTADPSFENTPSAWPLPGDAGAINWRVVSDVARTGKRSLRLHNPSSSTYNLVPRMPIPAYPGCRYTISAYLKTQNIEGSSPGATIFVQWYDQNNKWLGYAQAGYVKGSKNWTKLTIPTTLMPEETRYVRISPSVQTGCTGTVWFDDISAEIVDDSYLRTLIKSPNYKSSSYVPGSDKLVVGLDMTENYLHPYENLTVSAMVRSLEDTNSVALQSFTPTVNGITDITFPKLPVGKYRVTLSVFDNALNSLYQYDKTEFEIVSPSVPTPAVYFDKYNRCVADGKLFFPIGAFVLNSSDRIADLSTIASTGINCVLDYGIFYLPTLDIMTRYLNACNANNIKSIFSLSFCYEGTAHAINNYANWCGASTIMENIVETYKDHPALLAWYINDELKAPYLKAVESTYKYIKQTDPNHPTYQVMSLWQDSMDVIKFTDAIGIDDYPVYNFVNQKQAKPLYSTTITETYGVNGVAMGSRPVWMTLEASSQKFHNPDSIAPTYEEMLCSVYSAIVGGARGIMFYDWTDVTYDGPQQVAALKSVIANVKSIEDIALGIDAGSVRSIISNNSNVSVLTRVVDGELWVVAVNPYQTSASVRYTLPSVVSTSRIEVGTRGNVTQIITPTAGSFSDVLEPLGVRVYRIQ